jgi:hypothetical protein
MISIQDVLAAEGIDISGWSDLIATGVSADGHVIVGNGVDPLGRNEAWIAHVPLSGTTKVIQTDGSTSLAEVGDQYFLFDGNGTGPSLKQGGMDVVAGQFGAWTPIGAVQTSSGYDVAWKNGSADQYTVWSTDSNGNFLSYSGVVSGTDFALESLEPIFNQDFNSDQIIGPTERLIKTDISTSLTAVSNPNHFFLLDSSNGSGPSLKQNGMDVVAGQFGAWTPIGGVQTGGGYDVAWKNGNADQYTGVEHRQQRQFPILYRRGVG